MTDGPIANHWPDVPPAAFTILRQIAQERQRQAEMDARAGSAPHPDLAIVSSVLCEPHSSRAVLIACAALIVLEIERRDGSLEPPAPLDASKLIRGR
jgi:hypothetical protein